MKTKILTTLLVLLLSNYIYSNEIPLDKIKFASISKAKELLTTEDQFTNSWSQFDINSRLGKKGGSKSELFEFIKSQTKEWSKTDQKKINKIFESINKSIRKNNLSFNLPEEIYFVNTSGREEGGADGYTRANYIVLSEKTLTKSITKLKEIVIHELFHVLTRHDHEFRKEMYEIIGFQLTNDVAYPNSIKDLRITNPDAPQVDSYITLNVKGKSIDCMMILYAKEKYNGGSFFNYVNIGFLSLTGEEIKTVVYENNQPVIFGFKQVENFFDKVGNNTDYIIHPEEILAENFVKVILNKKGLPNMEIVNQMKSKLTQ